MRFPEPDIATGTLGAAITVTARYETPEGARLAESLRRIVTGLLSAIGIASVLWAIVHADVTPQYRIPLSALGVIAVIGGTRAVVNLAAVRRFGLHRHLGRMLALRLDRHTVHHDGHAYRRGGVVRFTAMAHREGRHEERAEREKERLLSATYRDAWQVWLQHGENFILLADVSDEHGAAAIVRRLQEVDEQVTRGGGDVYQFGSRATPD